ncbi:MAG: branched-chain amino acid aminotransferase, partial [Eubacteriales bacterium]|nr:branched-chain amino acid aminotransferase [Eubacteriales bacterium]
EVIPMIKVDGRPIGEGVPGTMTWQLIREFRELTKSDGPLIFPE